MNNKRIRYETAEWIKSSDFEFWITLTWNRDTEFKTAKRHVGKLLSRVDKMFLGNNYYKKPVKARTLAIFFFEHIDSNIHCHSYWTLPGHPLRFIDRLEPLWKTNVPSGTVDIKSMSLAPGAFAAYGTKCLTARSGYENVVFSGDFIKQ